MKQFSGNALFLDRADINTDEIIPAKYLSEITKDALKPHLLEDLNLEGFDRKRDLINTKVVVTRSNFGCGSSREHAPWAFEINGINLIIAESFARIFKQNMFNCGMMALELPPSTIDMLIANYKGRPTVITADLERSVFIVEASGNKEELPFVISDYNRALVQSEGWLEYADSKY